MQSLFAFAAAAPDGAADAAAARISAWFLDPERIYHEPDVFAFARGREIRARFPGAELVEVPDHRAIPELYGNDGQAARWIANKRGVLVLGVKKSLGARPNGRSAHFIATSHSSGCAMACAYCYVPRRKGFANPVTTFVNIEAIARHLEGHARRQGPLPAPDQIDDRCWVYDVGENGDCSADALVCDNVRDLVALFRRLPNAKASFATKFVNRDLLDYDPQGKTRVRFSLMPRDVSRVVDVRTTPVPRRIAAIDDFHDAGYEVHLNFSPVIVRDGWLDAYAELFDELADGVRPYVLGTLAAEIIFLTHNAGLHEVNLGWHPRAEELLWRPELQEPKRSQTGGENLRYRHGFKGDMVARFVALLRAKLPMVRVRYAF